MVASSSFLALFVLFFMAWSTRKSTPAPSIVTPKPGWVSKIVEESDGKRFYADNSRRDWKESSRFCSSNGMRLASITTAMQNTALNEAAKNHSGFNYYYWTAGRDSHTATQFTWNGTDESVSEESVNFVKHTDMEFLTCLAFKPMRNGHSEVYNELCSRKLGVLCELTVIRG